MTEIILAILLAAALITLVAVLTSQRSRLSAEAAKIAELSSRLERQAEEMRRQSVIEFKALSEDVLADRERSLRDESRRQMSEMLDPLRRNLDDFRKAVSDFYLKDADGRSALNQQIESLITANREIGQEARKLSNALSSDTRVQGKWGETVLETLLTRAGFERDRTFYTQKSTFDSALISDESGRTQRPDVIVILPESHCLVIDSKVSISAFLESYEATDRQSEQLALKKHAASVKSHVDELARHQYHKNIKGAMEHTLMFIPNDSAYIAAVNADPTLWDYAYDRNVVIVSSTHLFSVMQIISQLWREENQNRNAIEIAKLGGLLYDKFANFCADFKAVATSIDNARKAYDKCISHLEHPSVGLMARAEKLRKLGAKTTKTLNTNV